MLNNFVIYLTPQLWKPFHFNVCMMFVCPSSCLVNCNVEFGICKCLKWKFKEIKKVHNDAKFWRSDDNSRFCVNSNGVTWRKWMDRNWETGLAMSSGSSGICMNPSLLIVTTRKKNKILAQRPPQKIQYIQ